MTTPKKKPSRFCTLRIRLTSLSTRQCKEKASKRTSREWLNENLGQKTLRHSSRNWIAFQMRARGRKILWWECCSTGNRPLITRICRKPGEILKLNLCFAARTYEKRRVIITDENLFFAHISKEQLIDYIPLSEVVSVDDLDGVTADDDQGTDKAQVQSLDSVASTLSAFQVRTLPTGCCRVQQLLKCHS